MSVKYLILTLAMVLSSCGDSVGQSVPASGVNSLTTPKEGSEILVTITSQYKDKSPPFKDVTVKGSGFLVRKADKQFVITAAHVSTGANVEILYQGSKVKILGDFYKGSKDLHVIEVERFPEMKSMVLLNDRYIEWKKEESVRLRWVDSFNFVLLNDWVIDPNLEIDNFYSISRPDAIHCAFDCVYLNSATLMQPGSSGSPLLSLVPEANPERLNYDRREAVPNAPKRYFLRGMTLKRDRFFVRSSFMPAWSIALAIEGYLKREAKDDTNYFTWNVSGDLMYRTGRQDTLFESSSVSSSVGNSVSMDGGNSVSMDGGDFTIRNEDEPSVILKDISAFPKLEGKESMNWLFISRDPQSRLISGWLYFDMAYYAHFSNFLLSIGAPTEDDKTNYLRFLLMRLNDLTKPLEGITASQNSLRVTLKTLENTTLDFVLNKKGAYCKDTNECASGFQPIIEVPDSTGQAYIVDLRGFAFVDPELSHTDAFRNPKIRQMSDKEYSIFSFAEREKELERIKLQFRKKRSVKTPLTIEEGRAQIIEWSGIKQLRFSL